MALLGDDFELSPEDLGRAATGDGAALRRLRDYWIGLAAGHLTNPLIPAGEALPQAELLASLADSGEAEDSVALLVAYQVRLSALGQEVETAERFAKQAADAENVEALCHWTESVVRIDERRGYYRGLIDALLCRVFDGPDAAGPALLILALSIQADSGDEAATPLIQSMLDAVTPERAQAILAEVRKLERLQTS